MNGLNYSLEDLQRHNEGPVRLPMATTTTGGRATILPRDITSYSVIFALGATTWAWLSHPGPVVWGMVGRTARLTIRFQPSGGLNHRLALIRIVAFLASREGAGQPQSEMGLVCLSESSIGDGPQRCPIRDQALIDGSQSID